MLLFKSKYLEFTPKRGYLKVVMVGGKFEGVNLEIFALVLFLVMEKACECPTSKMKNSFYPTPLILGLSLEEDMVWPGRESCNGLRQLCVIIKCIYIHLYSHKAI